MNLLAARQVSNETDLYINWRGQRHTKLSKLYWNVPLLPGLTSFFPPLVGYYSTDCIQSQNKMQDSAVFAKRGKSWLKDSNFGKG